MNEVAYTISVVLSNCYLTRPVQLGPDARVVQLADPLGFRGEMEYVIELCRTLGVPVANDFLNEIRATVADTEQAAILQVRGVVATSPEDAEMQTLDWIDRVCDTLSVLTTNAVTPIAYLMSANDQAAGTSVRLLPPPESKILLGYHDPQRTLKKADGDRAYAVLCRVFRIAQQARRPEFRIFHYGQLLELASETFPGGRLRKRIDRSSSPSRSLRTSFRRSTSSPPTPMPPTPSPTSETRWRTPAH